MFFKVFKQFKQCKFKTMLGLPVDQKVFSVKYVATTLIIVVIIAFLFSMVVDHKIIIKDNSGNKTGEGVTKFTLKKFGKI